MKNFLIAVILGLIGSVGLFIMLSSVVTFGFGDADIGGFLIVSLCFLGAYIKYDKHRKEQKK